MPPRIAIGPLADKTRYRTYTAAGGNQQLLDVDSNAQMLIQGIYAQWDDAVTFSVHRGAGITEDRVLLVARSAAENFAYIAFPDGTVSGPGQGVFVSITNISAHLDVILIYTPM